MARPAPKQTTDVPVPYPPLPSPDPPRSPRPPHLDLLGGELLGAAEHVALGDALAAELVDLHHAAEGDEAHQGVGGQQGQGHLEGLAQRLQVLLLQARVHHVQEDERGGGAALERQGGGGQPTGVVCVCEHVCGPSM